jgi:hypothetical protein
MASILARFLRSRRPTRGSRPQFRRLEPGTQV